MDARRGVIVVGGGAAGMVASIAAARAGAAVTLLERMPRVGKKLLATGNGRCNLANARLEPGRFHGEHPGFAGGALGRFGLDETLAFFRALGVEPREEEGGKIFPRSGQASAVLDLLRHELARLGVDVRCDHDVRRLAPRRGGGWDVQAAAASFSAGAVVLAGGGRASPQLGSNGSGHAIAAALGHLIVEPFPALTRIRVRSPWLRQLKGVKLEARATLRAGDQGPGHPHPALSPRGRGIGRIVDISPRGRGIDQIVDISPRGRGVDREIGTAAGEVLFTETGLSGPPILDLSRTAGARARAGLPTILSLDLCPEIGADELAGVIGARFAARGGDPAELPLVGFLHKRLIAPVLRDAGVADPAQPAAALGAARIAALAALLKDWRFEVAGTDSWSDAQVTAGGVDTAGVDPATLASRRAPGLYLAGELLDVDGDCGGFNLQWAWSSGFVAGTEAAACAARAPR